MAIYRAEGALGADAQEGRETVGESLTPAEAHRRNGIRDRVFCDGSDDLAVRKGLFYPAFVVWNVAEKPSVALEIIRLSSRLAINAKVVRGYLDLVEGDPFVHILLKQPLKQLDNLGTFGAWLVTGRSCRQSSASETRSDNGRTMLAKVALIRKWLLISSTKCKSRTVVSILPQRCGGVNDILCGLMMGCSLHNQGRHHRYSIRGHRNDLETRDRIHNGTRSEEMVGRIYIRNAIWGSVTKAPH
jgi:hypothetical protein